MLTFRRLWTCPTSPGNVPRRGKIQRPSWSSCWVIGRRAGQFWRPCTSIRPYCLFKRNLCTLALLSLFRPYVLTIDKQLNVISKGNCQARFNEKRQGLWHTIDINADKLKDNENIAHFLKHKTQSKENSAFLIKIYFFLIMCHYFDNFLCHACTLQDFQCFEVQGNNLRRSSES